MKGWKNTKPNILEEQEIIENFDLSKSSKIKITKALITMQDVLRYTSESESKQVVLGSYGIGVVSEAGNNILDIEKGTHVYIEPNLPCLECYNCKNGNEQECSDIQIAGEDFDGFLRDFGTFSTHKLFPLPDSVSDLEALFIGQISLAIAVVDKLDIQKGDYVAIIGANNFGNILAQLLIYYQSVPILVCSNEEDAEIAKESGIYYVLNKDDNLQKEVSSITGGRMTKSVVYISDCNIPANKAFSLASYNANIAFTGVANKFSPISFAQAIKKQLNIHCINSGFGNTAASINLIANKAISLSSLKLDTARYEDVPIILESMSEKLDGGSKIYETVVDLI